MAKTKLRNTKAPFQRAIFTLPPDLLAEAKHFAGTYHAGNNSGFVAAALRAYIDQLKKARHTATMRESYAAAAGTARKIAADWDASSAEAWRSLDAK